MAVTRPPMLNDAEREEVRARIDSLSAPEPFKRALVSCLARMNQGPRDALLDATRSPEWQKPAGGTAIGGSTEQSARAAAAAPSGSIEDISQTEALELLERFAVQIEERTPGVTSKQAMNQAIQEHPELMKQVEASKRPAGRR